MRFADRAMRAMSGLAVVASLCFLASLGACADGFGPVSLLSAPDSLVVTAVRPGVVRLSWVPPKGVTVAQYIVQRRVSFTGPFTEVARISDPNLGTLIWLDTDVQPETVYGYRVFADALAAECPVAGPV